MTKFVEYVGNASTTASYRGRQLGKNVSVAVYECGKNLILTVDVNGVTARGIPERKITREEYEQLLAMGNNDAQRMNAALEFMGCISSLSSGNEWN